MIQKVSDAYKYSYHHGTAQQQHTKGIGCKFKMCLKAAYDMMMDGGKRKKASEKTAEEDIVERERTGDADKVDRGCIWGDRWKLEAFQSRVDLTDRRTPEAASTAPIGFIKPENPENTVL